MKMRFLIAATLAMAALAGAVSAEVSEGQVVVVTDWVLYIRTATNEPVSFYPYYVPGTAQPALPSRTVLPALESGEVVRVTWTLDTRDGKRRINRIEILSPLVGVTKGYVNGWSGSYLIIRAKDEPGTVTLNPQLVKSGTRWISDPVIVRKLTALRLRLQVTVTWAWDSEGRKRITGLVLGW